MANGTPKLRVTWQKSKARYSTLLNFGKERILINMYRVR